MDSKTTDSSEVELTGHKFEDLDIDDKTKKVLKSKGYVYLTKVQSKVLPLALEGKNLVIQSPTGSGKTLCFLLPTVKHLFDEGYSGNLPLEANLLGCICLAPTRELASQIALQMKDLAIPLKLNSGCCIGGVRDKYDKKNAIRLHILTGTPGRILALLSSQSLPDTSNIKILILDEADRLIDVGFRNDIISIVDFLPRDIQFMFFSATIKSSLKELCNLLIREVNYEMVCLGGDVEAVSESKLRQECVIIEPKIKITTLFYILSKNQNKRIIVFLSTCKLVRFMYEVFKRVIPAIPMTELHGKQSQNKRLKQFTKFAAKQNHGCIFTTDLAARGIDFPLVDLVIQFDLPDSIQTYTHRVGRTGRLSVEGFRNQGRTLILVNETEEEFIKQIKSNGIIIHNQTKLLVPLINKREKYVTRKLQAILAKESWIKDMAQRAIVAHLRYVTTRRISRPKNQEIIQEIKQMAISMGLPYAPNIQLVENEENNEDKSVKSSKLSKLKNKIMTKKLLKKTTINGEYNNNDNNNNNNNNNNEKNEYYQGLRENEYEDDEEEVDTSGYEHERYSDNEYVSEEESEIENEDDNDVIYPSKQEVENDIERYERSSKDPEREIKKKLAISRTKLRLNRRGVAKLRGVVTLKEAEKNHVFFSDEELSEVELDKSDHMEKLQEEISERDKFDKVNYKQIKREIKKAKKL